MDPNVDFEELADIEAERLEYEAEQNARWEREDDTTPGYVRGSSQSRSAARSTNVDRAASFIRDTLDQYGNEPLTVFELRQLTGLDHQTCSARCSEMFDAWCLDMPGIDRRNPTSNARGGTYLLRDDFSLERYADWRRAQNRSRSSAEIEPVSRQRPTGAILDQRVMVDGLLGATPSSVSNAVDFCILMRTEPESFTRPRMHLGNAHYAVLRAALNWAQDESENTLAALLGAARGLRA